MKFSIKALAMGCGFTNAFAFLVLGLTAAFLGWGNELVELASKLYLGYGVDPIGLVVGVLWAFVDGFLLGALFATVYNKFL
ncbi:MAG: membrane-associated protein [Candidatus Doudnabacteria bacterium CG10_big_fil_rev_8_21_14_0_10_41_10]|uniref:Membrane-associated protein n=1 Tax=Candidatus Doudnabacteria bacterium CG10_big_fil_rev_8_21_14_0_10_41_10 TaxID=1974551 RepID=A0A2H0VDH1_9BACT|nr:MAG: membrane-associated protein [Candidatus Doudnabacteria bacterium CG10_big_fil_rev_8_21_14_0_10_41_10]